MTGKLQDSAHRLGVTFATLVILVGMALAVTDMMRGSVPRDVATVGAYTLGLATVCYVVVRLVGWAFAEAMISTREHKMRSPGE